MGKRVFVTVGETSGDLHASNLVRELRALDPSIEIHAHGGDHLRCAGATIHHDTVSRATMGLRAVFRAREISRILKWTREYYQKSPPDLHICVDSWSMNYHFAKIARQHRVPVLYYIAPQTWASREGRVKKMRQVIDRLACILPFEEKYFRDHGIDATYVGHPLIDELQPPPLKADPFDGSRRPVIGLLFGSRTGIALANANRIIEVAQRINLEFPKTRFLIPATPSTGPAIVGPLSRSPRISYEIGENCFDQFVPKCDFALTVSGTAALHVAAYRVPLCIVYQGNPILWHLIGRWIIKARTYSLVNILSGKPAHIAREFIPWYGSTKPVADHIIHMLKNPQLLEQQRRDLDEMIRKIESPGASKRAAELALELIK